MKFSISTSFYRRNNLVETLYKQLLDQTHTDWEWVVTDDFSDYNNAFQMQDYGHSPGSNCRQPV